uniref:Uncharacterized protein n=1 Tax=Arundo donax TaxID=35708 RepID=A0A0A9AFH1_ARUDO
MKSQWTIHTARSSTEHSETVYTSFPVGMFLHNERNNVLHVSIKIV